MLYLVLLAALAACAIEWASLYVGNLVLLHYMTTKNYTLPSDQELKACSAYVVRKLIRRGG